MFMLDNVVSSTATPSRVNAHNTKSHGSLDADIIDLEGKILSANDAVYELLGFRTDEVLEQSLSRFISPEETREFTAALREVIERGATRNARLNPRSASGEVIPTSLNASALRDADGKVIGAIGILRDMRELDKARAYADSLIKNAFLTWKARYSRPMMPFTNCWAFVPTRCWSNRSRALSVQTRRVSLRLPCAR